MSSMLRAIKRNMGVDCRAPAKVRRANGQINGRQTKSEQADSIKNKHTTFLNTPLFFGALPRYEVPNTQSK